MIPARIFFFLFLKKSLLAFTKFSFLKKQSFLQRPLFVQRQLSALVLMLLASLAFATDVLPEFRQVSAPFSSQAAPDRTSQVLPDAFSPSGPDYRVIGGNSAPSELSWIVSIRHRGNTLSHFCGGTLIADRWVLTAAHCFDDLPREGAPLEVVIGRLSRLSTSNVVDVKRFIVHPNYNKFTVENDIALVELALKKPDVPVTLLSEGNFSGIGLGETFRILGWGYTNPEAVGGLPIGLMSVDIQHLSLEACRIGYQDIDYLYFFDSQICAGVLGGGKDACLGDSGGPLVYFHNGQWVQVGIVSWGIGCAEQTHYGVYTKVSSFQNWIEEVTQGLSVSGHLSVDTRSVLGYISEGRSTSRTMTLRNNSLTRAIALEGMTVTSVILQASGSIPVNSFRLDNRCPAELAAQASCTFDLIFEPSPVGFYQASIQVDSSANVIEFDQHVGVLAAIPELSSALNAPEQTWYSIDQVWSRDFSRVTGKVLLKSADIAGGEQSLLATYVRGPVTLNYVASLQGGDDTELSVFVNHQRVQSYSGQDPAQVKTYAQEQITLGAGEHHLLWLVTKQPELGVRSTSSAWLDLFEMKTTSAQVAGGGLPSPAAVDALPANAAGGGSGSFIFNMALMVLAFLKQIRRSMRLFKDEV